MGRRIQGPASGGGAAASNAVGPGPGASRLSGLGHGRGGEGSPAPPGRQELVMDEEIFLGEADPMKPGVNKQHKKESKDYKSL